MHNLGDNILTGLAAEPTDQAAGDLTGVEIDRKGYEGAVFTVLAGLETGTPTSKTIDAKIQECDVTGGTFTDVTGATLTTIIADSTGGEINVDLNGLQRFVKIVVTVAFVGGSTPTCPVSASYALGLAKVYPV